MNKINWYFNRFSLMSPSEVVFRIKEEIRKKIEYKCFRSIEVKRTVLDKKVNWYLDFAAGDRIVSFVKEHNLCEEGNAQGISEHKASFFSLKNKFLGEKIDWHLDYKNNQRAPLSYSKSIDYRDFERAGDIKYVWELNRHQHLIRLAKAFYLTGNKKVKREVCGQIESWIESNPYMRGVNWASSLELAIRLISWSWTWSFLGEIEADFRERWLGCIYKHCEFISKNISRYSSANNHLIGEAAGLFIASIVWQFEKESKKWQDNSYRILVAEIERQNFEDGVNKEQAISYQQFVLDFFILAGLLGEKNGLSFPQSYWSKTEKMIEFIASIMDKEGNVPNIGDADDGYAVTLSEEKGFNPFQSILATGAVIFKRGDFKGKAKIFDEKSFWLLGIKGYEEFISLEEKEYVTVKNFGKGGYFVLNSSDNKEDEVKCIFDCGPLGYLTIAAHGHSDALSFTLSVGGKEFIIDPGTYAYHTNKEWREYFKGTSAHNTIRIDGENQSVSGGNFMWLKKAKSKLVNYESNEDYDLVIGEHDGYVRLKDSVLHQRELMLDKKKKVIRITDRITANKKHIIEQFFHFSKDCIVKSSNKRDWEIKNGDKTISLRMDQRLKSKLYYGSVDPIFGWQSKHFDVKEETKTLVNSCEWVGACEFVTVIEIG